MTKVIDCFPWESISQLNKSKSWIKKKIIMILCSCFILLNVIPLLPVISPYSSLGSHHFRYLLSSVIYSLILALEMSTNASHLWESSDGVIRRTELPLCFMILIICCPQILLLFGVGFGGGETGRCLAAIASCKLSLMSLFF